MTEQTDSAIDRALREPPNDLREYMFQDPVGLTIWSGMDALSMIKHSENTPGSRADVFSGQAEGVHIFVTHRR